ncbi:MAG: transposase [Endomicrobium sp.]|jgi:hypothetical protein|nr:transposase [Endomicrobium sp.]
MSDSQVLLEKAIDDHQSQLLPGFIHIDEKEYGSYAVYCKDTFVKDGKVYHSREYLGKVIDRELGLYFNRQRGYFTFDLNQGYGDPDPDVIAACSLPNNIVLHFGDVWLVDQMLRAIGLDKVLDNLIPNAASTVKSLVAFRLLETSGYDGAEEWYRTSYARILYPDAILTSSMTSKYIAKIGQEEVYRNFFYSYLSIISKDRYIGKKTSFPILIDSTGLPNDIKTHVTAVNNHNGVISNEIRLIYVVDKITKLPIYFRYVPGNIIDNSTLITTINSLVTYGININLVILDAGYTSLENLSQLLSSNISFVTRMTKNRTEYKELIRDHGQDLQCGANALTYEKRSLYGKKVQISFCGKQLYAYIMYDSEQKVEDEKIIFRKYKDDPDRINKIDKSLETIGKFIILASDNYDINEILPLYYNRQTIEQVFDISKNFTDLLPLRAHSEETIRGRLLLSFISTIIYILVSKKLDDYSLCANKVLIHMHNLKIKIYNSVRLLEELTKIQKQIFQKLNLDCPFQEERNNLLQKDSIVAKLKSYVNRGRGRPKGSKNKKTSGIRAAHNTDGSEIKPSKKRGRPIGIKNKVKPKKDTLLNIDTSELKPSRGRGRPKGSKNKVKSKKDTLIDIDTSELKPSRGRGRPKGSKNKIKNL